LERLALNYRGIGRSGTENGHGSRGTHVLTFDLCPRDQLWSGLLSKQLSIIKIQEKLLEKSRKTIEDLRAYNRQLLEEIEQLKRRDEMNSINSRSSSPASLQFLSISKSSQREAVHRSYTVRRVFPRTGLNLNTTDNFHEVKELGSLNASHTLSPTPRKTRSSAQAEDLVPSRDWSHKRNRSRRTPPVEQDEESVSTDSEEPQTSEHERNEMNAIPLLPRIEINCDGNYLMTPDPQFLIPSLSIQSPVEEVEIQSGNIEVPSWRKRKADCCRLFGGGEDLHDSVYNRRHFKAEEDEKRRKRWDAQKTREEEYVEQLKERLTKRAESRKRFCRAGTRKASEDGWDDLAWIDPFHPNAKEALFLQVDEKVPINVFGTPLPAFSASEFSLPWDPTPACATLRSTTQIT